MQKEVQAARAAVAAAEEEGRAAREELEKATRNLEQVCMRQAGCESCFICLGRSFSDRVESVFGLAPAV